MEIMGGSPKAEPFKYFCSLMVWRGPCAASPLPLLANLSGNSQSSLRVKMSFFFCSNRIGTSRQVRSFLAVRSHMDRIVALVALMTESGTACIRKETVESLRARFVPDKNEREAAQFILERVSGARDCHPQPRPRYWPMRAAKK
jgi:hypothetical protein